MTAQLQSISRAAHKSTQTLTLTSGKGGVGKSSLTANLALQLGREGERVLILDGDISMANMDIMYGVRPQKNLYNVLAGECTVEDIITEVERNVFLIPGGSGIRQLQKVSEWDRRNLLDQVSLLPQDFDYLMIDTAPGIDDNVLALNAAAQSNNVIITPDPASMTDAYALIKVLNRDYRRDKFSIICNQVRDVDEGLCLYKKLADVVDRFLFVSLDYKGAIPLDPYMRQSTKSQQLVIKSYSDAPSARALKALAHSIRVEQPAQGLNGGMQFFWSQVLELAC